MTDLEARATALDSQDELAHLRDHFVIPPGVIYLDGNSLGLMPESVPKRIGDVAEREWAQGLIRSWSNAGWFHLPETVGDRIAPIIGVDKGEVAVGDSTSVNLFKCLAASLHAKPGRRVVLAEGDNFPTDSYMAQGLAELVPDVSVRYLEKNQEIADALGPDVAVLMLSHVDYRTAVMRDMETITQQAHAEGALVLWDLSHTTGAVRCDLKGANVDMAVGCTYKYLNGGPGAPAFVWMSPRLTDSIKQPLAGWMGHVEPFNFSREYKPAAGARRLVCGSPQVLSLTSLDEALKIWDSVNREALFAKSRAITDFFIDAVETLCEGKGLSLICPRDASLRGSHVSFDLEIGGFEVMQAMVARGVIGDFRAPSTLRFGFAPLYLRYKDAIQAAVHLAQILETREWDQDRFRVRGAIT